jgi:alkylation response protein AidB-like acyl-CoA dehydrogenase
MDFSLTSDQKQFADAVRNFALRNLQDGALQRAHQEEFPREMARLFHEQGLMGITIPEADGGQGGTLMDAVIAIEQIALVCPRSADIIQEGNFGAVRTLAHYANEDQKNRFLRPVLEGRDIIAVAMTEPGAGSAVTDLTTTATPDGEGFRISGQKIFPNPYADVYLVYVRFGPGVGGIGSVMVRAKTPGFTIGKASHFMSGAPWAPLFFDNVYVPPEDVLLPAGGFKKQISGFNAERIGSRMAASASMKRAAMRWSASSLAVHFASSRAFSGSSPK